MADTSEQGAAKPPATGAHKTKGGRVVESRYLEYEKRTKKASVSAGGKLPEGKKASTLPRSKEDSQVTGRGDLQSTVLKGHDKAPPDLDPSVINDKSVFRKPPQLDRTISKEADLSTTLQKKRTLHKRRRDLQKTLDVMESQTLLLTLLSVKMENNLALLEEKAGRNLAAMCCEKERLQRRVLELRRQLLLQQKHQELTAMLDAQIELLSHFQAVAERFKEQYKTLATALDTTQHELPMQAIHVPGSGQELLAADLTAGRLEPASVHPPTKPPTAAMLYSAQTCRRCARSKRVGPACALDTVAAAGASVSAVWICRSRPHLAVHLACELTVEDRPRAEQQLQPQPAWSPRASWAGATCALRLAFPYQRALGAHTYRDK